MGEAAAAAVAAAFADKAADKFVDVVQNTWEGTRRIRIDIHNILKHPLQFKYVWFEGGESASVFDAIQPNTAISYRVKSKMGFYGVEGILVLKINDDEEIGIYFSCPYNGKNHHYIHYYWKVGSNQVERFRKLRSASVNSNYPIRHNINGNLGLFSTIEGGNTCAMIAKVVGLQSWNCVQK